ncbi:MAG: sensor histidine kinase [Clostridia bacterium]|nr:sensor histidine kinase [Clostridia bacterium]
MKDELEKLSIINHKFSSRISALELYVKNLSYNSSNNIEINNSILEAKKLTQSLSAEFSNEMHINLRNYLPLNKTGITNIDNILEYFEFECMNKNISFNVIVKSNIEYEVKRAISLNLLETLISDMLNNAIIAINHNTNKNNKILVQFDMCDYLEIRIYDTGIEFEINTLVKLGKEQITTHKSDGGSGIGFITTFETLNKTNGSLIIEEYKNDKYDYSKCLIFKFDNKKQFIIRSYRADEIKELSNNELIIQPSL